MNRLRQLTQHVQSALEVYREYDLSLLDAWQLTEWKPYYAELDSASMPDIDAMASARVRERRAQRQP